MLQAITTYLNKILIVLIVALSITCVGLYLSNKTHRTSLEKARADVTALEMTVASLRTDIDNFSKEKSLIEESFETVAKEKDRVSYEFSELRKKFETLRCDSKVKVKNEQISQKPSGVVPDTDIADTIRLLNNAHCLSDPRCKRP